jgi:predicted O-methyltransferase YrrM
MTSHKIKSVLKSLLSRYQTLHLEYPVEMKPRYGFGMPYHPGLVSIIGQHKEVYASWIHKALSFKAFLLQWPAKPSSGDISLPAWNNGFLPGLDILMLYTIVASARPETYVEIGSGNSTKVVARAKKDHQLLTQIISLDPAPRAEIDQLADKVIRKPFENTDLSIFRSLKNGDIVFVDNSHRVFPNSDATVFFMEVLPKLAPGVIVHFHDIYLPADYPQDVCDRYYSEQYVLAAFLMANPDRYKTIMPCYYVSEDKELSGMVEPLWNDPAMPHTERHGASFWLQIGQ